MNPEKRVCLEAGRESTLSDADVRYDSASPWHSAGKAQAPCLAATVATNAMQDITERGGTLKQSVIGGLAAGAFETLFEKFSIGNFQKLRETANVKTIRDFLSNVGKSTLVNASEESATGTRKYPL